MRDECAPVRERCVLYYGVTDRWKQAVKKVTVGGKTFLGHENKSHTTGNQPVL